MRPLLVLFLFLSVASDNSFAQAKHYKNKCELANDLLDSASVIFFDFRSLSNDSIVIVVDVDEVLSECAIINIGTQRLKIINTGTEYEEIKKEGIFKARKDRKNFFIFTKEQLNNLCGFRLYHPKSNGDFFWGFVEKNGLYSFKKKSYGWF